MTTSSFDKFRKLLAAYEDEVQRKQHKMGKRVDPRDEVQPNYTSGYCTFIRGGQQVVWSPSFEVIGTYTPASNQWVWGWSDATLDFKLRTRVDEVRKRGVDWGIELMTTEVLAIENEQQAWELSTVAAAVSRADAMYRIVDAQGNARFVALFDGPPANRSSTSMRALRDSSVTIPSIPAPAGVPSSSSVSSARLPSVVPSSKNSSIPPRPSSRPVAAEEREPTQATRNEIGQRLWETVPYAQQSQAASITALARATAPTGPVGTVTFDLRVTIRTTAGVDQQVAASAALHDAFGALWMRCRERNGAGFRFATAKLESGPQGMTPHVLLEF